MTTVATGIAYRHHTASDHLRPFAIVAACAAISALSIGTAFTSLGVNEYGWRAAVQYSGRAAVLLFLLPFLAGPIAILYRPAQVLLTDRRAYGLGFAAAFALYLATVIAPFLLNSEAIPPTVMAVWGIGAALVFIQIATSNALSIRLLGFRRWSRIHTFAMYAFWTAFTVGFLDRVAGPSRPDIFMPIGLCLMIAAFVIRFAAAFKVRVAEKVA